MHQIPAQPRREAVYRSFLKVCKNIRYHNTILTMIDKRILVLGLISTCFEGSMYLFVFFWSAALKSSHAIAGRSTDLPFGLIFATFMASMMLGSLLFSLASASSPSGSPFSSSLSHANILVAILVLGSVTLLLPVFIRNESFTFWCFCIYEACVGVYFPSMGNLKGTIVGDGVRAKVYGVLRVPLNVFVVIALSLTQEGSCHILCQLLPISTDFY